MSRSSRAELTSAERFALFAALVCVRLWWASGFGPSDGELMAWASSAFVGPFPAPFGEMAVIAPAVAILGDSPASLRLGFAVLAAVPVLMVGSRRVTVALAASLPILTVPGSLATGAAPLAVLWLGAWRLAQARPALAGVLSGLGAAFHPVGLWMTLPAVLRARRRWPLLLTATLAALPFLPGSTWSTTRALTGELSPAGLALAAVVLGGPLLLVGVAGRLTAPGPARLAAVGSLGGVLLIAATGAPAPLLAGPLALGIFAVSPESGAPHRVAWHAVGVAAVLSVALAAVLRFPVAPFPADPRARFVDTTNLAQAVASWEVDTVYALSPPDIARLRWHGLKATSPPPVHPLDLPDDIVLVMPQSADPDLPFHMGWDHDRDGPHDVVVHIPTPDPTRERAAAAWSVSYWSRPIERRILQ